VAMIVVEGDMKYILPMDECEDLEKLKPLMNMV